MLGQLPPGLMEPTGDNTALVSFDTLVFKAPRTVVLCTSKVRNEDGTPLAICELDLPAQASGGGELHLSFGPGFVLKAPFTLTD
jgi:hypothetical protein